MFIFYKHSKKKYNDQELTKYLINVCGPSFHAVFFLSTNCALQRVYHGPTKMCPGSLHICRDGSVSTLSESVDY